MKTEEESIKMKEDSFSERHLYEDIINLPHHVSGSRPQMPASERAAQFSPFAALTGFGDAIKETERHTDEKAELSEDAKEELDEKLRMIQERIEVHPEAAITYFRPDERKDGGEYVTLVGHVKKIAVPEGDVVMEDGSRIAVRDIVGISAKNC